MHICLTYPNQLPLSPYSVVMLHVRSISLLEHTSLSLKHKNPPYLKVDTCKPCKKRQKRGAYSGQRKYIKMCVCTRNGYLDPTNRHTHNSEIANFYRCCCMNIMQLNANFQFYLSNAACLTT